MSENGGPRTYSQRIIGRANGRLAEELIGVPPGLACDVSMGVGHNVLFLCKAGWRVVGLETSDIALIHAQRLVEPYPDRACLVQADPARSCLRGARFDLVVCTYFMDRRAFPELRSLVRPGGRIFFESYDTNHLRYVPDFPKEDCLREGEPQRIFEGFQIMRYHRIDDGQASVHSVVALLAP